MDVCQGALLRVSLSVLYNLVMTTLKPLSKVPFTHSDGRLYDASCHTRSEIIRIVVALVLAFVGFFTVFVGVSPLRFQ